MDLLLNKGKEEKRGGGVKIKFSRRGKIELHPIRVSVVKKNSSSAKLVSYGEDEPLYLSPSLYPRQNPAAASNFSPRRCASLPFMRSWRTPLRKAPSGRVGGAIRLRSAASARRVRGTAYFSPSGRARPSSTFFFFYYYFASSFSSRPVSSPPSSSSSSSPPFFSLSVVQLKQRRQLTSTESAARPRTPSPLRPFHTVSER